MRPGYYCTPCPRDHGFYPPHHGIFHATAYPVKRAPLHARLALSFQRACLGREGGPSRKGRGREGEGAKSALGMWRARSSSCVCSAAAWTWAHRPGGEWEEGRTRHYYHPTNSPPKSPTVLLTPSSENYPWAFWTRQQNPAECLSVGGRAAKSVSQRGHPQVCHSERRGEGGR